MQSITVTVPEGSYTFTQRELEVMASLRLSKRADQSTQVQQITFQVCQYFNIDVVTLKGKGRTVPVCNARAVLIGLLLELAQCSLKQVGRYLDRDHSTIINSRDQLRNWIDTDEAFAKEHEQIKLIINETY